MPTKEYVIQTEHTSGLTAKHYHGVSISTLNDWAKNNIPSNAVVSSVQVYYRGKLSSGDTVFYVGFSKNSSTEPGHELINSSLTTSAKEWYGNVPTFSKTYPFNITSPSSSYSVISVYMNSGIIYKKFTCYSFKVIYTYSIPNYTVTVNAGTGGTVTGAGSYQAGNKATVTATPNNGYKFVGWANQSGVITNTANPYSFTVTGNTTFSAVFEKTTCTATFKNDDGTTLQTVTVEKGSTPSYTGATPTKASTVEYDYTFTGWSPSLGAIDTDTTYTAQFSATRRRYTIVIEVSEGGSVWGAGTYSYGTTVELVATSSYGYKFVGWSDGVTSPSRDVTVTGDATYTAIFEIVKINQVYVGTTQPKAVYVGTREVKAIYLGTTKFYGY